MPESLIAKDKPVAYSADLYLELRKQPQCDRGLAFPTCNEPMQTIPLRLSRSAGPVERRRRRPKKPPAFSARAIANLSWKFRTGKLQKFWVTPARRGKRNKSCSADEADQTQAEKRASMAWAKRLKRVFNREIETCGECGADVRIIASMEDPAVIRTILLTWKKRVNATDSL